MSKDIHNNLKDKMTKAFEILGKDLKGLRTGRASVNFLDPVVVDMYGSRMPLAQLATVSVPESTTILVQVWDKQMVKTVEKAIADANLGINPSADGQVIRVPMPPLSEERRKEMAKLAHKYGEASKVVMRNIRRDGMDLLKKMEKSSEISKDDHHSLGEKIQKLTDDFISKIDEEIKSKEKEVLSI